MWIVGVLGMGWFVFALLLGLRIFHFFFFTFSGFGFSEMRDWGLGISVVGEMMVLSWALIGFFLV